MATDSSEPNATARREDISADERAELDARWAEIKARQKAMSKEELEAERASVVAELNALEAGLTSQLALIDAQ